MKRSLLFFLTMIVSILLTSTSCKSWRIERKRNRDARQLEREKRAKEAEAYAKYKAAVKRHASNQTPKTRRAMKKAYKKAYRHNYNKREFFLKRWFKSIQKRTKRDKRREVNTE